jgi:hypothetical protein
MSNPQKVPSQFALSQLERILISVMVFTLSKGETLLFELQEARRLYCELVLACLPSRKIKKRINKAAEVCEVTATWTR